MSISEDDEFWLFGYGSLIWKPPPHYDIRLPGYIEGYVRRFWQASEDHRGTPEAPGRVVTLIDIEHWRTLTDHHDTAPEKVWGAAYHIPAEHVAEVRDYLDIREINGYSIRYTPFHPSSSSHGDLRCLVYIGLPDNPQFLGPQDPDELARHILKSRGPSGENREYLYMLGDSLVHLSEESGDEHINDLVRRCRQLESETASEQIQQRNRQTVVPSHPAKAEVQEEVER